MVLLAAIHLGPAMQRVAFERVMKQKFGMGEPDEKAIESQLKTLQTRSGWPET
jgi:glutathione S-transferase